MDTTKTETAIIAWCDAYNITLPPEWRRLITYGTGTATITIGAIVITIAPHNHPRVPEYRATWINY